MNKYLEKIINEYVSYKLVYQDQLSLTTENIKGYLGLYQYYFNHAYLYYPDKFKVICKRKIRKIPTGLWTIS
jgi:hypothetical protein